MKKIGFLLSLLFGFTAFAQKVISGAVLSATGNTPLQGVNIAVKGKGTITTTNNRGAFSIKADSTAILVFSHVGYAAKEIPAKELAAGAAVMLHPADARMTEITVSTGYQEIRAGAATGSFAKINTPSLDRIVNPNVLAKLEGLTPGLYFSKVRGSTEMALHGLSTINAATQPLIIVDNFPYEGDIADINPADVESITLLKDASAASIWGAKAGNGVIVVTTRKGTYNGPARVSVTTSLTVQQKPNLFYSRTFLGTSDFIDVEKFLFAKGFYDATLANTTNRPVVSPVIEIVAKQRAGQLSATDAATTIDGYRTADVRTDMARYLYQPAIKQQYAVNFSGGSSFVNYFVGLGFDKERGSAVGNGAQRKTINATLNTKTLKSLEIGTGIYYTLNEAVNNSLTDISPAGGKSAIYPYARLADGSGTPLPLERFYRLSYIDTTGAGQLLDWKFRPLDEIKLRDFRTTDQHILARLSAKYSFTKGLNAELKYQWERSAEEAHNYTPAESFFARDLINLYSQRSGNTVKRNIPYGGYLDQTWNNLTAYSLRGQVNYSGTRGLLHQWSAIAGAEVRSATTSAQSGRTYGYNDDMTTYANVDYLTQFTLWNSMGINTIQSGTDLAGQTSRFLSLYANGTYTYRSTYTVTASARKDASNIFGVNTNQKWQPLWSAGGAWKLSSESFYRLAWLPLLKFRASYGYAGNVLPLSALTTIRYNSSPQSVTNLTYASIATPPNPDLSWEKVGTVNGALDFAFRGDCIRGSIDYYRKTSTGLLSSTAVDPTVGVSNMTKNTANLKGEGVDLDLIAKPLNKALTWTTELIFSYVTNKITRFYASTTSLSTLVNNGYTISAVEGRSPYSLASYKWAGLDPATGDPQGYYLGKISKDWASIVAKATADDIVLHGTTRPPLFGNWLNTVSFRGFSFTANMAYKLRYWFRRQALSYTALYNLWQGNQEFAQRWQKPGDEQLTNVPSMVYPAVSARDNFYVLSEATVEKGDLIRLQDISLAYSFPRPRNVKAVFQSAQLYIYATNCGILWRANNKGLDPDFGTATPPAFSVSVGFKTTF